MQKPTVKPLLLPTLQYRKGLVNPHPTNLDSNLNLNPSSHFSYSPSLCPKTMESVITDFYSFSDLNQERSRRKRADGTNVSTTNLHALINSLTSSDHILRLRNISTLVLYAQGVLPDQKIETKKGLEDLIVDQLMSSSANNEELLKFGAFQQSYKVDYILSLRPCVY